MHHRVILTRGIAMPRGTNNVTGHTQGPGPWHFYYFFFQKIKKNKKI